MEDEIQIFKENISLVDFIQSFGGKKKKQKSTQNSSVIDFHDTKLIVKRNKNGHYTYFDISNSKNSGTIIDFYQNNVDKNASFVQTIVYLRKFYNYGYTVKEELNRTAGNEEFIYADFVEEIDENDLNLIQQKRHIAIETLHEFQNVILKDIRKNFCFPHMNYTVENEELKSNLIGYEIKNIATGFKSQQGQKGLWEKKIGNSNDIYLFESSFDAIAFRELHKKNGFYISFGGSISPAQMQFLKILIKNIEAMNVFICLDNDKIGNIMSQSIINDLESFNISTTRLLPRLKDFNDDLKNTKPSFNDIPF